MSDIDTILYKLIPTKLIQTKLKYKIKYEEYIIQVLLTNNIGENILLFYQRLT